MKRFCICTLCSHLNVLTFFPLTGGCSEGLGALWVSLNSPSTVAVCTLVFYVNLLRVRRLYLNAWSQTFRASFRVPSCGNVWERQVDCQPATQNSTWDSVDLIDSIVPPLQVSFFLVLPWSLLIVVAKPKIYSVAGANPVSGLCVVLSSHFSERRVCGHTSRGHTGRSHRISPPSFCGACLSFSREKGSAIPFPGRP